MATAAPKKPARAQPPAGYTERELEELRALEADIHAGRITEADGTSLEGHMDRATRRAARMMRSSASG